MKDKARKVLPRGYTLTPLYRAYHDMKDRCLLPTKSNYKHYGGRGIKVCDEWKKSYLPFYLWAMKNGYEQGLQLDRIDNDGDYSPENCRWATKQAQENNKRTNVRIEYQGETHTIAEWARLKGIHVHTLRNRLWKGWSAEKALNTPTRKRQWKESSN